MQLIFDPPMQANRYQSVIGSHCLAANKAVISLDFSLVFTCPNTIPASLAKAETK
jgi:hypothetical protein